MNVFGWPSGHCYSILTNLNESDSTKLTLLVQTIGKSKLGLRTAEVNDTKHNGQYGRKSQRNEESLTYPDSATPSEVRSGESRSYDCVGDREGGPSVT